MKLLGSFFNISEILTSEKSAKYEISLNPKHLIYQAHFPDNPITPGVCMIQMSGELLSDFVGKELFLHGIHNIKFMKVLSPLETDSVDVELSKIIIEEKQCKANVIFDNQDNVYAKMSLIFGYERM
jgi:3-hydroxyacyl-[acyl-carrier-protein] dehydratase